jgi:hypothetical protein
VPDGVRDQFADRQGKVVTSAGIKPIELAQGTSGGAGREEITLCKETLDPPAFPIDGVHTIRLPKRHPTKHHPRERPVIPPL